MRLVRIHWRDAEVECEGWRPVEDLNTWRPPGVESVGFVLHEATDLEPWWVIAADYSARSDDRQANRPIVIPAGMVRRVEELN